MTSRLDLERIEAAARIIEPGFLNTPQFRAEALEVILGCRWVKAHSPRISVIGVCAAGAPAMAESWRAGRLIEYPNINTIAAGIGVRSPIPEPLADMAGIVDDVVLVSDEDLIKGMRLLHDRVGLVVEPSGAPGVAALLAHPDRFRDCLVASVISGGNLSPEEVRQWLI